MFFIILLFLSIFQTRRITLFELHLENICLKATQAQFGQLSRDLNNSLPLLKPNMRQSNCTYLSQYWSIAETFRYGRWCGKSYGGFNGKCKDICIQNLEIPSDECLKCLPPIDWVDEQCLYHDFCFERFQLLHTEKADSCDGQFNLGNPFPSPCSCAQNLTFHLRSEKLQQNCEEGLGCLLNGKIIHDFFDSAEMKCSCVYKVCNNNTIDEDGNPVDSGVPLKCWAADACVQVDQCHALGGC